MAIKVPICIDASTGFLNAKMSGEGDKLLGGWMGGPSILWAIATRNREVLASMTRITGQPFADLSPSLDSDCIKKWFSTSCNKRKAAADCVISELDTLLNRAELAPPFTFADQGNTQCFIRIGGDCEVVVIELIDNEIKKVAKEKIDAPEYKLYAPLFTSELCGDAAGSPGAAELAALSSEYLTT